MTTSSDRAAAKQLADTLAPCPFCGLPIYQTRNKINPFAVCKTEDCFGAKMPVVNVDQPDSVAAWNRRAFVPEVKRLREALKPFADIADLVHHTPARDGEAK